MNGENCGAAAGGQNQMSGFLKSATWVVVILAREIEKSRLGVCGLQRISGDGL
jgi:hypothetical protein